MALVQYDITGIIKAYTASGKLLDISHLGKYV